MTFTCQTCNVERVSLDCGPCMAVKLGELCAKEKKRADEAEAKFADVVKLLEEIEWDGWRGDGKRCCPCCSSEKLPNEYCAFGSLDRRVESKHRPNCRLAALIGKAGA